MSSEPTYDDVVWENQTRWVEYLLNWSVLTLNEHYSTALPACWFYVSPDKSYILNMEL